MARDKTTSLQVI
ncbi:hypothetical protein CP082626L3_0803, partial [Chlamydia psittaci 08-2626_L3]